MLPEQSPVIESLNSNGKNIQIYGSDRFFIDGLKILLKETFLKGSRMRLGRLIIKVWTDVNLINSVYTGHQPQNCVFVVICPLHTMQIVKWIPGYENAIFVNASSSISDFILQVREWLEFTESQFDRKNRLKKTKKLYMPNIKERSLIASILLMGEISTIAKIEHVPTKTLHSRLGKLYQKLDVNKRQDLIKKVQILFEYGFWKKADFIGL